MEEKNNFTFKNDAAQQQHQKLIQDFAKFLSICWSHKVSFILEWDIWTQFWPKLQKFKFPGVCQGFWSFKLIKAEMSSLST